MRKKYDIIVIGSGIGGLVSAALLVDSGKKVLIVEKEPKPGGYLTEFKNEGFAFDVSLHLLNGCAEGQYVYNLFKRCGIIDEIKFVKPKHLYRSIFPDFDLKIPQTDLAGYKRLLVENFPGSQNGIEGIFREAGEVFDAIANHNSSAPITPLLSMYLKSNAEDVINKHIKDNKLKAVLYQLWMYFGLPPSMLRAVDFWYPWFDYSKNGGYYVERSSFAIVKALVNYIESKGGEFLFNRNIGRIVIENNLCKKVQFGRDEIFCDVVISNADITRTVHELIGSDQFPVRSMQRFKRIEPSISAFDIFLGLNVDLRRSYPDDYEIFVNPSYNIEEQYRDSILNRANKAPFAIAIYSNVNKFAAPERKSVVTITMLSGYDYWRSSSSKQEYQDKKQRIADILLNRASKIIPEIKDHVQKKVVSTPVTFERYSNNLRGAIYGYTHTTGGRLEVRPNEIKGIDNLYFASAWARQGSGVAKVLRSADEVARKILSKK
ncbi:MAG: NAD(P)/FAD-dependent oxidoreductase [Candidatus Omnitrophota bacterium]